jgi:hypothetical protein
MPYCGASLESSGGVQDQNKKVDDDKVGLWAIGIYGALIVF